MSEEITYQQALQRHLDEAEKMTEEQRTEARKEMARRHQIRQSVHSRYTSLFRNAFVEAAALHPLGMVEVEWLAQRVLRDLGIKDPVV